MFFTSTCTVDEDSRLTIHQLPLASETGDSTSWIIKILQNGQQLDIILVLTNKSEPFVAKIKYCLIMINSNSRTLPQVGEAEFHFGNVCEHKVTKLQNPYPHGDTRIEIRGEIRITSYESKSPILVIQQNCSLGDNLLSLLKDSQFSDVELVSWDNRRFRAHVCILAARSPVFSSMFEHNMVEKQNGVVEIDDVDGEIMQRLLDYIYGGRFYEEKTAKIQQLLIAADKYALDGLKACCEESLVKRLHMEIAIDLLVLADDHSAEKLKEKALEFIANKFGKELLESPKFLEIEMSHPKLTMELLRRKWL